jgi:hypothetical protein
MPWFTLESIPGLIATESQWERLIGRQFTPFKALCLETSSFHVQRVRCPRRCGCNHLVIPRHDGCGAIGACRCDLPCCPDIVLCRADITALEVSDARLGRALCKAFGFAWRHADLLPPNTFQFGCWSSDAVPAILTIQVQNSAFRRVVAELVAQLPRPFMLFAPTSDFLDAPSLSILQKHRAQFFPLNSHVVLTEGGTLRATRPPGELFAGFTPQPKELEMDVAARSFALVRKLDTDKPLPPPSLLTVFRLYCMEDLSTVEIARKCKCNKTKVVRRLSEIRRRIGIHPLELRRLSPHIAQLEDSLRDPRASRIHARRFIDDNEQSDDAC